MHLIPGESPVARAAKAQMTGLARSEKATGSHLVFQQVWTGYPLARATLARDFVGSLTAFGAPRNLAATALAIVAGGSIVAVPTNLTSDARIALVVFTLATIGWTMTKLGDTWVALVAAGALVLTGVAPAEELYGALGNELVWLLLASFVVAAALKGSGLTERLVLACLRSVGSVASLFRIATLAIATTALVVPSTSGRAALLLPVFVALSTRVRAITTTRALALLFPTVILLSAGGSLIGAGAHLVAADFIVQLGGRELGYVDWLMLAMPFSLLISIAACETILHLFLTQRERKALVGAGGTPQTAWTREQVRLAMLLVATVALWATSAMHNIGIGVIAVAAALAATSPVVSSTPLKPAMKSVEWELMVFLAATLMMGKTLQSTNADEWIAQSLLLALGDLTTQRAWVIALVVALVSSIAHLVITSRTARATVLIPALAMPLIGIGFDPTSIILVIVMATGFCQTMMVSAKPVAMFGQLEQATYGPSDLVRLSVALLPMIIVLLMAFSLLVWPFMGIHLLRDSL